jgi:hypothetical protein
LRSAATGPLWQRHRWQNGGRASQFYRFLQRCGIEPFAWFQDVLSRVPAHSITRLSELLPHNWKSTTCLVQA